MPEIPDALGRVGMVAGAIFGVLLLPWLRIFHLHSGAAGLLLLAAIGAGYYGFAGLSRCIGDTASLALLGRIHCILRHHDLKPDGAFLHNGCQCVRCGYRPHGRALMKLR